MEEVVIPKKVEKHRSDEIDQIMAALANAQGSYKSLKANQDAPGGKFANLQAIIAATSESLSKNGLAFYQFLDLLDEGSGAALLKTIVGHSSGQWISSTARVVAGKTDRATGNTLEIHKRLHAMMVLGIAPSDNDPYAFDDNGEMQAEEKLIEDLKKPVRDKKSSHQPEETIDKHQYNELLIELDQYEDIVKDILEVHHIETLADLPKSEYHPAMRKIRKLKKLSEQF